MQRNYERLTMEAFGRHLLETGDLDPVYIALNKSNLSSVQRNRWLTAYSAFYHCGVASYLSEYEGMEFWQAMDVAAANEVPAPFGRWPRGSERRHFRGQQALKAVSDWASRYGQYPQDMFTRIAGEGGPYGLVAGRAMEHRSVGNWLSFKMVDLVDACMGKPIDQSDLKPFLYETPRKSLLREWRERQGLPETARPKDEMAALQGMLALLQDEFKDLEVPHKPGQAVDMFCLETIACKHQSHLNGHYPLYNDIREIRHGLKDWTIVSETAQVMLDAMPPLGEEAVPGGARGPDNRRNT